MNNKRALFALLGGVALGAIIGILFAPDKGEETRKKVADKGKKLVDSLKEKFDTMKSTRGSTEEEANVMNE